MIRTSRTRGTHPEDVQSPVVTTCSRLVSDTRIALTLAVWDQGTVGVTALDVLVWWSAPPGTGVKLVTTPALSAPLNTTVGVAFTEAVVHADGESHVGPVDVGVVEHSRRGVSNTAEGFPSVVHANLSILSLLEVGGSSAVGRWSSSTSGEPGKELSLGSLVSRTVDDGGLREGSEGGYEEPELDGEHPVEWVRGGWRSGDKSG